MREGVLNEYEAIKKDPCWDPIKHKLNATKCPDGTSCYKQETSLNDVKYGKGVMAERLVLLLNVKIINPAN